MTKFEMNEKKYLFDLLHFTLSIYSLNIYIHYTVFLEIEQLAELFWQKAKDCLALKKASSILICTWETHNIKIYYDFSTSNSLNDNKVQLIKQLST